MRFRKTFTPMASQTSNDYRQLAVALGMQPNREDILGLELHDKIVRNDLDACARLIAEGVPLNDPFKFAQNVASKTLVCREMRALPLHIACIYRRPGVVDLLLRHGADPNLRDYLGRVPLQLVLTYWPRIRCTPVTNNMPHEERQYQKYLSHQHTKAKESLEALCRHGAKCCVNIGENNSDTLLHMAAKFNVVESILLLLGQGVNVNIKDGSGRTALIVAAQNGNFGALSELLYHGADVNVCDEYRMTALHYLCSTDKTVGSDHLRLILRHGACVNARDLQDNTPLHHSCRLGNESAMDVLLRNRANPDVTNAHGRTPLYLLLDTVQNSICFYGLELLYQSTLYINVIDKDGKLPELLCKDNWKTIKCELVAASARPPLLARICRLKVRRALSPSRLNQTDVNTLPCAPGLKKIILLNVRDLS